MDDRSSFSMFTSLSHREKIWFCLVLVLLVLCLGFATFMLLIKLKNMQELANAEGAIVILSKGSEKYIIELPTNKKNNENFSCIGTVVGRHYILTSSFCAKAIDTITVSGKTLKTTEIHESELDIKEKPTYNTNLQLKLIRVSSDLNKLGFLHLNLPSLNYPIVNHEQGLMLYYREGKLHKALLDFIYLNYCQIANEKFKYSIDFNLFICAIIKHEKYAPKICSHELIGSPLIQNGTLVGILSYSKIPTCGDVEKPFIFINIIPYVQWITTYNITNGT